jgi:hypothetical protein
VTLSEFRSALLIERVERHVGGFLADRGFDRVERRRYRRTNGGVEHWIGVGAHPRRSYVVLEASAAVLGMMPFRSVGDSERRSA